MHDFVGRHVARRDPVHDLTHQRFDHLVHRHEPRARTLNDAIPTRTETLDKGARLHHQLADFGQYPGQQLAFVRSAFGKQMVFFDRAQDRLHLSKSTVESLNTPLFEPHQRSATALRQASQEARFVGIANGQLLRRGVR